MNLLFTKKDFIETLNFIKKQDKKQDKFIDALENLSPGCYCNAFIFSEYEDRLVRILGTILNDEHDDIGYFLYEMNWDKAKAPTDKNGKVLYSNAGELYDYLVSELNKLENTVL